MMHSPRTAPAKRMMRGGEIELIKINRFDRFSNFSHEFRSTFNARRGSVQVILYRTALT